MFFIKACNEKERMVYGLLYNMQHVCNRPWMVVHLPRELSHMTKIIIDRGAKVTAELVEKHLS